MADALQGGGATEQVKAVAADAQQKVQERAQQARGTVSEQVSTQLDTRTTQLGESLSGVAEMVRGTGGQMRDQGREAPARLADQAAERVESFGEYLKNVDGQRLLHDAEDFARRQPMVIAGVGLVAGFLASRFLRASSTDRYERSSYGTAGYGATGYGAYEPPTYAAPLPPATGYGQESYLDTGGAAVGTETGVLEDQAWIDERGTSGTDGLDLPQQVR